MMVLLYIKESKVSFFMELINNFSFLKAKPVTNEKALWLQEIEKEAIAAVQTSTQKKVAKKDIFAEVRGIWADRDIDATTLRNQAWRIEG
jgi:hypothetical protein